MITRLLIFHSLKRGILGERKDVIKSLGLRDDKCTFPDLESESLVCYLGWSQEVNRATCVTQQAGFAL